MFMSMSKIIDAISDTTANWLSEWLCALNNCAMMFGKQTMNAMSANIFCLTIKHAIITIASNTMPTIMLWVCDKVAIV